MTFGFHAGEYAGHEHGHQRCRNCWNWGYAPKCGVWRRRVCGPWAAVIGGAGMGGFGGTRFSVVLGVWRMRVCRVQPRASEVEESAELGLHA